MQHATGPHVHPHGTCISFKPVPSNEALVCNMQHQLIHCCKHLQIAENKNVLWLSWSIGACCKFPEGYERDRKPFQQSQPGRSHWKPDHGPGYKSCFGAMTGTLSKKLKGEGLPSCWAFWGGVPAFPDLLPLSAVAPGCCPGPPSLSLSNHMSLYGALNSDLLKRAVIGWNVSPQIPMSKS